ncbi:unnamed protein product [Protopolystoma xenopodis]|uniref:Uncharacterized protein n=1 Tax=Protopolystoma xenopodis TaxID=117903 RepID=A0A448WFF7_9PLAT|nr:unnamed protein product [Protopolystoma xenopodis]
MVFDTFRQLDFQRSVISRRYKQPYIDKMLDQVDKWDVCLVDRFVSNPAPRGLGNIEVSHSTENKLSNSSLVGQIESAATGSSQPAPLNSQRRSASASSPPPNKKFRSMLDAKSVEERLENGEREAFIAAISPDENLPAEMIGISLARKDRKEEIKQIVTKRRQLPDDYEPEEGEIEDDDEDYDNDYEGDEEYIASEIDEVCSDSDVAAGDLRSGIRMTECEADDSMELETDSESEPGGSTTINPSLPSGTLADLLRIGRVPRC